MFSLEVEGEDTRKAQAKVRKIFRDLGIECQILTLRRRENEVETKIIQAIAENSSTGEK